MKNVARDAVASAQHCAQVAVVGRGGAPSSLTYAVPEALAARVVPGSAVTIPLGPRRVIGIVLGPAGDELPAKLRPILDLVPDSQVPEELLRLATWAARYYQVPLQSFLRAILPPSVRSSHRRQVRPIAGDGGRMIPPPTALEARILARLPESGLGLEQLVAELGRGAAAAVRRLAADGRVVVEDVAVARRAEPTWLRARPACTETPGDLGRARRQAEVYAFVAARRPHAVSRAELEERFPGSARLLARLVERGLCDEIRPDDAAAVEPAGERELTAAQSAALAPIVAALGSFATFLLFGVTGSGKTEVYLRAASAARAAGAGVLVLVPEIALTHQLVGETYRRFAATGGVAVLHSGLGEAERSRTWRDVASGRTPVVIGARSAVFAPLPRLGLVVVDEEHDAAYKQEESPRYNARDLAVMRGKLAGCPVVLASATPALESYQAARSGRYRLLELAERANAAPLPAVQIIDLRARRVDPEPRPRAPTTPLVLPAGGASDSGARIGRAPDPFPLSPTLEAAIADTYRAGEQTLLFLNRRGYARFIQCAACGHVESCPNCSVSLTVHRARAAAVCHHCGYARRPASRCPSCDTVLDARSFGTEQVEAAVRALLPAARVARLDRDSSGRAGFLGRTIHAWRAGELDVLVGTQMIAKGHDVPGVTLIGVILADASLNFPDFRAAERTFQLIAQVAGRAGRGAKPGRVLVQTYQPEHPSLLAASRHDFASFAERELAARAELHYPPFGRLSRILLEGEEPWLSERAGALAAGLRRAATASAPREPAGGFVQLLGPAPAPIEKLRGRHRIQLLVKTDDHRTMSRWLAAARAIATPRPATREQGTVRTIIDVDPVSML